MFGGVNPRQLEGMMRKMGITSEDIPAKKVIIEKNDGSKIIITSPKIQKIKMHGDISYQIAGEETQENEEVKNSQEDIKQIMKKTGCDEKTAKETLEKTGDLAQAILELS